MQHTIWSVCLLQRIERIMTTVAPAQSTRQRILETAYDEFYHHGFQGGSLNRIVETAGITKGALFHHFKGKMELGYAVVDECIKPNVQKCWVDPINQCLDPVEEIKKLLNERMENQSQSMHELLHGCPLNNLAQEMSPLDETFRMRIDAVYDLWRQSIRDAFARGIKAGTVRKDLNPDHVASFLVASMAGMVGNAKTAQSMELLMKCGYGLIGYLDSLKK